MLTDGNYVILNILRPRQAGAEDVRLAVREKYPVFALTQAIPILELSDVRGWLENAQEGNSLKKVEAIKFFALFFIPVIYLNLSRTIEFVDG